MHFSLSKTIHYKSEYFICKDNKMRSPLLLSGPKIRKAYFEASNPNFLLHRPPLKSYYRGVIKEKTLDLKPKSRFYEFLVQIKVMDFSFDCLYFI